MAKYQHEPVNAPRQWTEDERRFALTVEKLFDDVYRKIGKIESLVRISEMEDGMTDYKQIKSRGNIANEVDEFLIKNAEALSQVPTSALPGSIAYTANVSHLYQKDLDGTWAAIIEPAEDASAEEEEP